MNLIEVRRKCKLGYIKGKTHIFFGTCWNDRNLWNCACHGILKSHSVLINGSKDDITCGTCLRVLKAYSGDIEKVLEVHYEISNSKKRLPRSEEIAGGQPGNT